MHRDGHNLDIMHTGHELIGVCECGDWRVAMPTPDGADVLAGIAQILRQHEQHLDELGGPAPDSGTD